MPSMPFPAHRRRLVALLLAAPIALACATPAHAGQIVYNQGSEVWTMNDDGSGARRLVAPADVPGMSELDNPDVGPGGTEVAFEGFWSGALAEEHRAPGTALGFCGISCRGVYVLRAGKVTRLTDPPPTSCGATPCVSGETAPRVGSDGSVAFRYDYEAGDAECAPGIPCLYASVTLESMLASRPGSGGARVPWATPCTYPDENTGTTNETDADRLAVNPANPAEIAYVDCADVQTDPLTAGTWASAWNVYRSGASRSSAADDVLVRKMPVPGAGLFNTVEQADSKFSDVSWSPDGTRLLTVEHGATPGVYSSPASAGGGARAVLVASEPDGAVFGSARYLGADRIAVTVTTGDGYDLYVLPASCSGCTLAQAKRLTTGGALGSPGFGYTASDQAIPAVGGAVPAAPTAPTAGGGQVSVHRIHAQRAGRLLKRGLTVRLRCAASCRATGTLSVGHGHRRVGRASGRRRQAGTLRLHIRIARHARARVRHARALTLRLTTVDGRGGRARMTRKVAVAS